MTTDPQLRPLETRGRAVVGLLTALAVLALVASWSTLEVLAHLADLRGGAPQDEELANALDDRLLTLGLVQTALMLACGTAFPMWTYRAYANLQAAGLPHLRFSPAWAAGGFFVPFLNLVRPYQVVREIWSGTEFLAGEAPQRTASWRDLPASPRIALWWGLFVLMGFTSNVAARMMLDAQDLDAMAAALRASLFSDLLAVPTAVIAIGIVRTATRRLERVRTHLEVLAAEADAAGEAAAPAPRPAGTPPPLPRA